MAKKKAQEKRPVFLVYGEDEYTVKRRARELFDKLAGENPDIETEVIDGYVNNSHEALGALGRLREALQTLPFFGSEKCIWLKNSNFLGRERGVASSDVTEALRSLAKELERFDWGRVRLLVSATKVDRQLTIFNTLAAIGETEEHGAWDFGQKGGAERAEEWVKQEWERLGKGSTPEARALLLARIGANPRQLGNEIEKIDLYAGDAAEIQEHHVSAVVARNEQAEAFALAEALGDRDLPRLLQTLKTELSALRTDRQKSEIGILYGLISKVRVLLLLKEMLGQGLVRRETQYFRFKAQWSALPDEAFPNDKRFNPKAMSPYPFFKALRQVRHYRTDELVRGMDRLMECNQRLLSSGLDGALVLQQTLVHIVRGT